MRSTEPTSEPAVTRWRQFIGKAIVGVIVLLFVLLFAAVKLARDASS